MTTPSTSPVTTALVLTTQPQAVPPTPTTISADLTALVARVRAAHAAFGHAAYNLLEHAMAVGDALLAAKDQIEHGEWLKFLRECELSEDKAERYVYLARHRAELSDSARVRNLSLNAARRLVKSPGDSKPPRKRRLTVTPKLSSLAWSEATPEERGQFLEAVGQASVREAQPLAWHELDDIGPSSAGEIARLQARVEGLANDKRRLAIENVELRSEIAEVKSRFKPDHAERIATLAKKITAFANRPEQHVDEIRKAAAEIRRAVQPESKTKSRKIAAQPVQDKYSDAWVKIVRPPTPAGGAS